MIAEIDYGASEPRDFQLTDNGLPFDGTSFTVAVELLQQHGLVWEPDAPYAVGDQVRPILGNGHLYQCLVAGTSDSCEPTWPTAPASTIVDGTVQWLDITPTVDWIDPTVGTVRVSGLAALGRDTGYRVRYLVTDTNGVTGLFPNKNRFDVWRVSAIMGG